MNTGITNHISLTCGIMSVSNVPMIPSTRNATRSLSAASPTEGRVVSFMTISAAKANPTMNAQPGNGVLSFTPNTPRAVAQRKKLTEVRHEFQVGTALMR